MPDESSPDEPPLVPEYNKPDTPGIHMNFDNTVAIYHVVAPDEDFGVAAHSIFDLLKEAQDRFPDWPRVLYLDIQGHLDEQGRFEDDFVELQQEFLIQAMGKFFTALAMPLLSVINPEEQTNELPDELVLKRPEEGDITPSNGTAQG